MDEDITKPRTVSLEGREDDTAMTNVGIINIYKLLSRVDRLKITVVYAPHYIELSYKDNDCWLQSKDKHEEAKSNTCPFGQKICMYKYFGEPRPEEDNQYFVEIKVDKLLAASCCMQIGDKKQFIFLFLPIKEEGHVSLGKDLLRMGFHVFDGVWLGSTDATRDNTKD